LNSPSSSRYRCSQGRLGRQIHGTEECAWAPSSRY
jgi:hypothetical protein